MTGFTTQRGRPRKIIPHYDTGTPELRLKHALRLTAEPIDLCLERMFITPEQHWCGLHLRWLYTLRYGAPNLTAYYADRDTTASTVKDVDDPAWRSRREQEYHKAIQSLKIEGHYECVMRLAVYNESPAFLNVSLQKSSGKKAYLCTALNQIHRELCAGLDILALQWKKIKEQD